jgi:hypothetical protein
MFLRNVGKLYQTTLSYILGDSTHAVVLFANVFLSFLLILMGSERLCFEATCLFSNAL